MKTTRVSQWRNDQGVLLIEYAHGKDKPFRVSSGYYGLSDMTELLNALEATLEVHRTDVPELEIGANA